MRVLRSWTWIFAAVGLMNGSPAWAAPSHGLELTLPSYVQRSALSEQHLTRSRFGVKIQGISQWVGIHQARVRGAQISVEGFSAYVHARNVTLYQNAKRPRVRLDHRWWIPLPYVEWKPYRLVWASPRNVGVQLRLKRPFRTELPKPVRVEFVQADGQWQPVILNPTEFSEMLETKLENLLQEDRFLSVFEVDIYGFGYPVDPLLNKGWKKARGPILSLIRKQLKTTWIPGLMERLRENGTVR